MTIRTPHKRASILRKFIYVGAIAGLLVGPLAGIMSAQEESDVIGRDNQDINDTRVTLSVTDRPLVDVVKYIREKSRVNIIHTEFTYIIRGNQSMCPAWQLYEKPWSTN